MYPPSPRVPLECVQGAQSPPLVARSKECSTFLIPTPTTHALLPSMAPWRTQPPPVVTCPLSSPTLSPVSVHLMEWKELRFECVWWSQRGNGIFRVKFGLTFHYTDLLVMGCVKQKKCLSLRVLCWFFLTAFIKTLLLGYGLDRFHILHGSQWRCSL